MSDISLCSLAFSPLCRIQLCPPPLFFLCPPPHLHTHWVAFSSSELDPLLLTSFSQFRYRKKTSNTLLPRLESLPFLSSDSSPLSPPSPPSSPVHFPPFLSSYRMKLAEVPPTQELSLAFAHDEDRLPQRMPSSLNQNHELMSVRNLAGLEVGDDRLGGAGAWSKS